MPERLARHRHLLLVGAVLLALVTQPVLAGASTTGRLVYDLLVAAIALSVLFIVFSERWERRMAAAFAVPAVILTVAFYTVSPRLAGPVFTAYHFSVALFLGFAVTVIVRDIFRRGAIGFDDILGAFAGYLLLGVVWGSLYLLVELAAPGSFAVSPDIRWQLDEPHLRRALFNYFSFATMTSLGYSDITAITPLANTLCWFQVMFAQFYLAVVIAQIVGLKLAQLASRGPGVK